MTYWKLNEDPFYDEDGVLIDEDADVPESMKDAVDLSREQSREKHEPCYIMDCDPYGTINS